MGIFECLLIKLITRYNLSRRNLMKAEPDWHGGAILRWNDATSKC
jgi:hypothetical protein